MQKLEINLEKNSYEIVIEDDLLSHLSFYIQKVYKNQKIFIITDDIVSKLYLSTVIHALKDYTLEYVIVPHGEESKSLSVYSKVIQELLDKNIRRNELLIALGGGVIGDLTGFVAATLYRGIPYVSIPTSLLSQMDSSIGGKTGIDFYNRKNIIGCFKQPKLVLIDPKTLNTLPAVELENGMGELVKHAIIGNKRLFEKLLSHPRMDETIIYESLLVKKVLVEKDELDQGERMFLNFGHTFGHAIELKQGLKHGQAVALGMLMAIQFGIDLGLTDSTLYNRVLELYKIYHLPSSKLNYKEYLEEVIYDKKNLAGVLRFVFVKQIGEVFLYSIEEEKLKELVQ